MLYLIKTENSSDDGVFTSLNSAYDYIVSKEFVKSIIEISFSEIKNDFVTKEYTIEQFKKMVLLT